MAIAVPIACRVFTPRPLADAMAKVLLEKQEQTWLEPSFGEGVFLKALSTLKVPRNHITGIDIELNENSTPLHARNIHEVDFIQWSRTTRRRFDCVIGNPPFLAAQTLSRSLQDALLEVTDLNGNPMSLSCNYWYAFVICSIKLLKKRGRMAFVLPSSFEYADYAQSLRDSLGDHFKEVVIHRCKRPLFTSVQEGSVVLIAKGYKEAPESYTRIQHATSDDLIKRLGGKTKLRVKSKTKAVPGKGKATEYCKLGDIVDIRLGGVTGDAAFFLLTDQERQDLELPQAALKPVLTKARHLCSARITKEEWERLKRQQERVWLFSPTPALVSHPAVKSYMDGGGCKKDGYKITIRNLWYVTPLPRRCHGFMSGMSGTGPWISLKAMPRLNATNTLYVVSFKRRLSKAAQAAWALGLLTTYARFQLKNSGRVYPDGLIKHEPNDIKSIKVPMPNKTRGAISLYREAIKALREGEERKCTKHADRFFG